MILILIHYFFISFFFFHFHYLGQSELPVPLPPNPQDQLIEEAFDALTQDVNLFNYVLGPSVPYATLKQYSKQLDQPDSQLTPANSNLLGQIRSSFLNGFDGYENAVQTLREFCIAAPQTTNNFLNYLQKPGASQEKLKNRNLLRLLDNAIQKFGSGQSSVNEVSEAFNQAFKQFQTLVRNLKVDYDENSQYFKDRVARLIGDDTEDSGEDSSGGFLGGGGSRKPKVDKRKVIAELKAKLAKILAVYVNYGKGVQSVVKILNQANLEISGRVQRLQGQKAEIEKAASDAPAGDGSNQNHEALIHSAQALIAACEQYTIAHKRS